MGCGSSRDTGYESTPGRVQNTAAAAQPSGQYQLTQQSPSRPVQEQVQNQQQQQQRLPKQTSPNRRLPQAQEATSSSSSPRNTEAVTTSEVQLLSPPETWPKVVRIGTAPFTVSIHAHLFNSPPNQMPCWTYVSHGISTPSQPEVVFTLLRRGSENVETFPLFPVEWIKSISALAQSGLHLETGELVELDIGHVEASVTIGQIKILQNAQAWQMMSRFGSLLHGMPLNSGCFQFPDDMLPPNAHHVIALTHEETAVAKQFGVTRVLGHLGLSVRWFPYPPWIDRDRGDTVNLADQGGSIRIGIPILRLNGLNAMLIQDDIILTIPADEHKRKTFKDYIQGLPLSAAVGLDSFMNEDADSGLTWKRGQKDPMGYASNSGVMKSLNLGFLMFAPQQDSDHCIMCEDGYGILIRDDTWKRIRDSVQNNQEIIIPLDNDKRFILQWKQSVFHNPIDGSEYTASWRTYRSSGPPKPPSSSHVSMSQVVFLVQPPTGTIDNQEFVDYVQQIQQVIEQRVPVQPLPPAQGNNHPGRQAVIEIELPKCEGWLKMTAYPSMDDLDIQGIMSQIGPLVAPETRAVVKVQLYFNLWGYEGPTAQFS
ncbi:hypothetical protein BKA65DRAFT_2249 [Rhexocercosporidium sp. MPI-PUGE-AT-0058]|nr:hypothetical protein BKA65DRAFT_2249 [Rhexocercosporidium sp. MPI-PUGE-AT-0058]